eukprot:TRINITY_DN1554_c0_g1_i6.p1 TRINITY_DN1554_c0_g1~~TRINITY_DN1554_c0_g1_i6.p1  ORF type:complete len:211 (-),score=23.33 TRINITY_DN1554_c0_g1_i6:209-841(-)
MHNQICFLSTTTCEAFDRNPFKRNDSICKNCQNHLRNHKSEAVSNDDLERFLKEEAGRGGNLILQHPTGNGKLFLGGSGASGPKFVGEQKITHVVNTAAGLEAFHPLWAKQVAQLVNEGLQVKRLEWCDSSTQKIWKVTPFDQIEESIEFIEGALSIGTNVAVHCAQGVSRSTTVICAYLMVVMDLGLFRQCISLHKGPKTCCLAKCVIF